MLNHPAIERQRRRENGRLDGSVELAVMVGSNGSHCMRSTSHDIWQPEL